MTYNKKTFVFSLLLIALLAFFIGRTSKDYTVVKTEELKENSSTDGNEIKNENYQTKSNENIIEESFQEKKQYSGSNDNKYNNSNNSSIDIPDYALKTLKYIREYNKAPENYVGGRTFQNREKLLPMGEKYQEWDVHPKVPGKNRGAERLVTSSSKAYYTNDHYRSFIEIKE